MSQTVEFPALSLVEREALAEEAAAPAYPSRVLLCEAALPGARFVGAPGVPNTCTSARLREPVPESCTRTKRPTYPPVTVIVAEGLGTLVW